MNLGEMIGWGESPWGPLILGAALGMIVGPTARQSLAPDRSPAHAQTAAAREMTRSELDRLADEASFRN